MSVDRRLSPHHRQEFDHWFTPPPYPWASLRGAEIARWWRIVRESEAEVLLAHHSGACALLALVEGVVVGVELMEGQRARALLELG